MSNRNGIHYGLTVLSPIIMEPVTSGLAPAEERRHVSALRLYLDELGRNEKSPFARVPGTHFARWVIWDDVFYVGQPVQEEHLESAYLQLTSNFDGELDGYLDAMLAHVPDVVQGVYSHCVGFPGVDNPGAFRAYIRRCQIPTTFFFADYPDATVETVLSALETKRRFVDFFARTQDMEAENLQSEFGAFMEQIRGPRSLTPGDS